jgi:hypothetical protein
MPDAVVGFACSMNRLMPKAGIARAHDVDVPHL